MEIMELNSPCRECEHAKISYYCEKLNIVIESEEDYKYCPYGYDWQRGEALYTWYCPRCGNQLLAMRPPMQCPECNALLGRKNVK